MNEQKTIVFELFKEFQQKIKRSDTYEDGIKSLMNLRTIIKKRYLQFFDELKTTEYYQLPFTKLKTIAYYLYHTARIEDITLHTLIKKEPQVFEIGSYQKRINSNIRTTGNELKRDDLVIFSKRLNIDELKKYIFEVLDATNKVLEQITYRESKIKLTNEDRLRLLKTQSVSDDPSAFWLVDYWCSKTYAGLMLMPFSRHQIMHTDNIITIFEKIKSNRGKNNEY